MRSLLCNVTLLGPSGSAARTHTSSCASAMPNVLSRCTVCAYLAYRGVFGPDATWKWRWAGMHFAHLGMKSCQTHDHASHAAAGTRRSHLSSAPSNRPFSCARFTRHERALGASWHPASDARRRRASTVRSATIHFRGLALVGFGSLCCFEGPATEKSGGHFDAAREGLIAR